MKFPEVHPTLYKDELEFKQVSKDDLVELAELFSYRTGRDMTAEEYLQRKDDHFAQKEAINWGMYLDGKLIGTIGYYRGFNNGIGEIGYVTLKEYRQKGYTIRGIQRILDYGLEGMHLTRIVAYTSEENSVSKHILNKLSFVQVHTDNPEYIKFEYRP